MSTSSPAIPRARYSSAVKQAVAQRYPLCRTIEDKKALADELGIESLQKLYNLSSRLNATQRAASVGGSSHAYQRLCEMAEDPARWLEREDPGATTFSQAGDEFLASHFGRERLAVIAYRLGHTETAMMVRARQLGLRKAARWWELRRVCAWLGVSTKDLQAWGVQLHRCCDRRGQVKIVLIDAVELAGALTRDRRWKSLVAGGGADRFFIGEIVETVVRTAQGQMEWGPTWVSYEHTCLSPATGASFGLFYDGSDEKLLGADLMPADISPQQIHHTF